MKEIIKNHPKIKFIAHRGLPSKVLENTRSGFLKAAKLPFFGIETDVHLTLDQVAILHHDDNLQKLTNKNLFIKETEYITINSLLLNGKHKIPLLHEFLDICIQYSKYAVIELKTTFNASQIEFILNQIETYNYMSKTIIISFYMKDLKYVRMLYPNVEIHYLTDKFDETILKKIVSNNFNISLHHSVITEKITHLVHKNNLKIGAWTVNTSSLLDKLATMGVDYITTDGIISK